MSAPSTAFFLLAFTLFVPAANALRCFHGELNDGVGSYEAVQCPPTRFGCFKIACELSGQSGRGKGCLGNMMQLQMACGSTVTKNSLQCSVHCCDGNLCNGVLAMHTPAIGRAVLVPLVIGILAAAFGILY
ncbi:hypothetical protein niasHT_032230 [Heterodera trifolii]|uniref:Uncharacterized protein n=1 Tax=Heterodera trifolii TaxID=157864 RepID=A0ABD2I005_9BILA